MIVHCIHCHHEWQATGLHVACEWCGSLGYKLSDDYIERRPDPTRYTEARQFGGLPPWRKQ